MSVACAGRRTRNSSLSSRALCPGSIHQLAPAFEDSWIPVTSTGMTISAAGPFLQRPARLGAGGLQAEGDAGGGRLDAIDPAAAAPAFHLETDTRVESSVKNYQ